MLAACLSAGSPAVADIYKYVDPDGVIHLTNVPTDDRVRYELLIREKRVLSRP